MTKQVSRQNPARRWREGGMGPKRCHSCQHVYAHGRYVDESKTRRNWYCTRCADLKEGKSR